MWSLPNWNHDYENNKSLRLTNFLTKRKTLTLVTSYNRITGTGMFKSSPIVNGFSLLENWQIIWFSFLYIHFLSCHACINKTLSFPYLRIKRSKSKGSWIIRDTLWIVIHIYIYIFKKLFWLPEPTSKEFFKMKPVIALSLNTWQVLANLRWFEVLLCG